MFSPRAVRRATTTWMDRCCGSSLRRRTRRPNSHCPGAFSFGLFRVGGRRVELLARFDVEFSEARVARDTRDAAAVQIVFLAKFVRHVYPETAVVSERRREVRVEVADFDSQFDLDDTAGRALDPESSERGHVLAGASHDHGRPHFLHVVDDPDVLAEFAIGPAGGELESCADAGLKNR